MNKNYLVVGAVVVVLLLAGLGFAFKHQIKTMLMPQTQTSETSQAPQTSQTPAENNSGVMEKEVIVEVDYTNSGFSPATITVKKGTTVKFVDKSGVPMSIASNPHPTHTDYPGFDQGKSDAKGKEDYSFTFDKVGTWGFHDHLRPSNGGTVVVTE